jgi:hypothetical protein
MFAVRRHREVVAKAPIDFRPGHASVAIMTRNIASRVISREVANVDHAEAPCFGST